MKQTRIIILTAFIALCAFTAIIQSACKKDKCKGVSCQNTGVCSNGTCTCPAGYFGKFCDSTTITFTNQTYTPLIIAVNGVSSTISTDSAITFKGKAGGPIFLSMYTAVTNTKGKLVGKSVAWSFGRNFPTDGDTYTEGLTIAAGSFFLKMENHSLDTAIVLVYVNYYNPHDQTYDTVRIPNDGTIYNIGYYDRNGSTQIHAVGSTGYSWTWTPVIPDTINSSATVTAN